MKQVKVSEASGVALDCLVARALGKRPSLFIFQQDGRLAKEHNYSTDWAQGGPVFSGAYVCSGIIPHAATEPEDWWASMYRDSEHCREGRRWYGPTELVAKARCYVANKLGEVVEVPEELA